MRINEGILAARVLSNEFGLLWPTVLINSVRRKNVLFDKAIEAGVEPTKYVKRLPVLSALYLELKRLRDSDKAMSMMRSILVPVGANESMEGYRRLKETFSNPMEHLAGYLDYVDEKGAGRFCERIYSRRDDQVCHRVVTKCPFFEFLDAAGTPELTQLFCEVDRVFYKAAFPDLIFHRNGSWENTIAYGKSQCDFVFEQKTAA